jgi:hypothetical protein
MRHEHQDIIERYIKTIAPTLNDGIKCEFDYVEGFFIVTIGCPPQIKKALGFFKLRVKRKQLESNLETMFPYRFVVTIT